MTNRGEPETGLYLIVLIVAVQCVLLPDFAGAMIALKFPEFKMLLFTFSLFISEIEAMMFLCFVIIGEGLLL